MLKQRIIAKLLVENGTLVKYRQFHHGRRIAGDPISTARILEDQRVDEFIVCDVGVINPALVRRMTEEIFCPVTAAGSIHTMEQVTELIRDSGVDKVVIRDPVLGPQVADRYGTQAVVWPYDYHGTAPAFEPPPWAGEALLTSITRDGMGVGMDIDVLRRTYNIPVVIAGGVGKLAHVKDALAAGASGVAVSSMFFFSDRSPVKLRSWLVSGGANVRVG